MNQPKFKFGDKLYTKGNLARPIVAIHTNGEEFRYSFCYTEDMVEEKFLMRYEEPQKKKLYAFISPKGEIAFKNSTDWIVSHYSTFWQRAPEYDIEYPESK